MFGLCHKIDQMRAVWLIHPVSIRISVFRDINIGKGLRQDKGRSRHTGGTERVIRNPRIRKFRFGRIVLSDAIQIYSLLSSSPYGEQASTLLSNGFTGISRSLVNGASCRGCWELRPFGLRCWSRCVSTACGVPFISRGRSQKFVGF